MVAGGLSPCSANASPGSGGPQGSASLALACTLMALSNCSGDHAAGGLDIIWLWSHQRPTTELPFPCPPHLLPHPEKAPGAAAGPLGRPAARRVRGGHRQPLRPAEHGDHRHRQHSPAGWPGAGPPGLRHGLHPDGRHHQRESAQRPQDRSPEPRPGAPPRSALLSFQYVHCWKERPSIFPLCPLVESSFFTLSAALTPGTSARGHQAGPLSLRGRSPDPGQSFRVVEMQPRPEKYLCLNHTPRQHHCHYYCCYCYYPIGCHLLHSQSPLSRHPAPATSLLYHGSEKAMAPHSSTLAMGGGAW